jgi:uncharacterized protein
VTFNRLSPSTTIPSLLRSGRRLLAAILVAIVVASIALHAVAAQTRGLDPIAQQPQAGIMIGNYYALVIGINNYHPPLATLKTAVDDAKAVGNLLHDRYAFKVTYLLDQNATRFNILDALSKYRNALGENDNLLIYYAGHGVSDREAQKAYWLPVDADSGTSPNRIIADDLTTGVRVLPSRHVLIVSDSCYSGALTRDANTPVPSDGQAAFLNRMLRSRSRTLMASGGDEPVSDSGSNGHSVFAYAVLRALESANQPMFTASDLFYGYVRQQVAGRSEQLPQYSIIRNSDHDEGDFVFARVAPPPPAPAPQPTPPVSTPRDMINASPASSPAASSPSEAKIDTSAMSPAFAFGRGDDMARQHRYGDAEPLFHLACDGGISAACTDLGWMYENGLGASRNDAQAVKLYRKACDQGNMRACNNLGSMHENGKGVEADEAEAVSLYRKSCDGADALGCKNLGGMYENGKGIGKDDTQAVAYYRKACDANFALGCTALGVEYANGRGVPRDYGQASTLFRKTCDLNDARGCHFLAGLYLNGYGVAKDEAQAARLAQKSCDGGYSVACDDMGRMYQSGKGVTIDDTQAVAFFRKACAGDNASGCTSLGMALLGGKGVGKDYSQAVVFIRKGCEDSDAIGCFNLAALYFNGTGVTKDEVQSASLVRKSCDSGYSRGCANLGWMYENGRGVNKDLKQAEELYHTACEGEVEDACKNLKRLKP